MQNLSFSQLEDRPLLKSFRADVAMHRGVTARIIAQLAEIDERELYLLEAYSCFHAFCVGELRCSQQKGYKWIQVTRAVRKFPALLEAIADGRLTRSGVIILASHLDEANAEELLGLTAGKSRTEIARIVAEYTSRMKVSAEAPIFQSVGGETQLSPGIVENAPGPDSAALARPDLALSAPTASTRVPLEGDECDLLRHAQDLCSHAIPSREPRQVVVRALKLLIEHEEKKKYGAGVRARKSEPSKSTSPRYIPAQVRWAVRQRDGERCTYVSPDGRRCEATSHLEYDHIVPVARGGPSTVENLRMRCRGHNQFEAGQVFGTKFMKSKVAATQAGRAAAAITGKPFDGDVVRCLRRLGLHVDEAQEAAANSGASPDEKIEERVRAALQWLGRARRTTYPTRSTSTAIPCPPLTQSVAMP
jgi:5-methylcytosine-specific restriction endonuclease McrA